VEAFLTGTGGEHEDTVGSLVTVEGGGRCTYEGAHIGNVLGVEHGHTVTGKAGTGIDAPGVSGLGGAKSGKRNAVQYIQGVVVAADGLGTAHDHLGLGTGAGCCFIDLHAGDLAGEGVHQVGFAGDEDFLVQFLDIVGNGFFRALDTEGGYYHAFQDGGVLGQSDIDYRASLDVNEPVHHSNIGIAELFGILGNGQ